MLTRKQRDLLEFIQKRLDRDGVPPSFEEMKDALDLRSKSGIHRLVTGLEERGYIRRLAHKARALEVLKLPEALARHGKPVAENRSAAKTVPTEERGVVAVPVMGRIAAGVPITAIQQKTRDMSVPSEMIGRGNHYALEVKGDSMVNAGINDRDVVVIREASTADNGDIVVALVDGEEATLKRYFRDGPSIALEAANPAYQTRFFTDDQIAIQGRLVGLLRTY